MLITVCAFATLLTFIYQMHFSYVVYVFTILFGVMDSAVSTHLGLVCGFEMQGNTIEAFSMMYFIRPIF